MRIIKLSPNDEDMINRTMVDSFFTDKLLNRKPSGQFLLTKGRISAKGISPGEMLVFSYNGEIVYLARSRSERLNTSGSKADRYPFYFCVDIETIVKGKGNLEDLEKKIKATKHIVKSQGWPTVKDTPELKETWDNFKENCSPSLGVQEIGRYNLATGDLYLGEKKIRILKHAFWHCFGVHAGESPDDILERKRREIAANGGWTLWSFNGKRPQTVELWTSEIQSAIPSYVHALCSKSRNAIDPKGKSAFAREFRSVGQQIWQPIPESIKVPHPFGNKSTASAFRVSKILHASEVTIPSAFEWLRVGDKDWRTDRVPTRGEYLLRPGKGTTLRPVCAILELQEPFVVEIRK